MEQALTLKDVATYLNVDTKTVYRLVSRGELPGFKVAGAWRFQRPDLEEWISTQKAVVRSRVRRTSRGSAEQVRLPLELPGAEPEVRIRIPKSKPKGALQIAGLFAGIGGIERGLHLAGHQSALLCELEPGAQRVLRHWFPDVPIVGDVRELGSVAGADLLAAGFPCQDLSQAGKTAGIRGAQSGLVGEVFRLLDEAKPAPRWLLLENVPFMLQLDGGAAMRFLVSALEERGMTWAYRVVDSRSFGLPQRRRRVVLLASKTEDPRGVLFADEKGAPQKKPHEPYACGFYWTEGNKGLGWAVDAVPTLKGGSTIGIPSPPAIWFKDGRSVGTPDIRDAERLQGFPVDWTVPATEGEPRIRPSHRWKLVGNAVTVGLAKWVGDRLASPGTYDEARNESLPKTGSWPSAAWGRRKERHRVCISEWPRRDRAKHLDAFLKFDPKPLSERATRGFLSRARKGSLRFVDGFLDVLAAHADSMARA